MRKFLQYTGVILLAAALVAAVVWINYLRPCEVCPDVRVTIINGNAVQFVTSSGVMRQLNEMGLNPVGKRTNQVNTDIIEKRLAKSEFIETVECYFDLNGVLNVMAWQLVPCMRVFDEQEGESYYVNREGKRMTAQGRYHIDVPVVAGHFDERFPPTRLLPIMDYVAADEVLSALVSMYFLRDTSNFCIVPTIAGHIVNMGSPEGYDSKFKKLMLFYSEVMPHKGWNTYSEITLKWDYQIVATLRGGKKKATVEYDPVEDEQAPRLSTVLLGEVKDKTAQVEPEEPADSPPPPVTPDEPEEDAAEPQSIEENPVKPETMEGG